jgi:transcriptional regulator with XRE-family HTH domain
MDPIEIVARRRALGLSQDDLATALGVSQMAVSRWETGSRAPRDPVGLAMQLGQMEDDLLQAVDETVTRLCAMVESDDTPGASLVIEVGRDQPFAQVAAARAAVEVFAETGVSVSIVEA